jgi:hypothetical protein
MPWKWRCTLLFERKYGIRSETFYAACHNGEEPDDERWVLDFGEGASVYKTWQPAGAILQRALNFVISRSVSDEKSLHLQMVEDFSLRSK